MAFRPDSPSQKHVDNSGRSAEPRRAPFHEQLPLTCSRGARAPSGPGPWCRPAEPRSTWRKPIGSSPEPGRKASPIVGIHRPQGAACEIGAYERQP